MSKRPNDQITKYYQRELVVRDAEYGGFLASVSFSFPSWIDEAKVEREKRISDGEAEAETRLEDVLREKFTGTREKRTRDKRKYGFDYVENIARNRRAEARLSSCEIISSVYSP